MKIQDILRRRALDAATKVFNPLNTSKLFFFFNIFGTLGDFCPNFIDRSHRKRESSRTAISMRNSNVTMLPSPKPESRTVYSTALCLLSLTPMIINFESGPTTSMW